MKTVLNEKVSSDDSRKCKRSEEVRAGCTYVCKYSWSRQYVGTSTSRDPRDCVLISFKGTLMTTECLICRSNFDGRRVVLWPKFHTVGTGLINALSYKLCANTILFTKNKFLILCPVLRVLFVRLLFHDRNFTLMEKVVIFWRSDIALTTPNRQHDLFNNVSSYEKN